MVSFWNFLEKAEKEKLIPRQAKMNFCFEISKNII